ncbi:helix-turn-helix transcriptional regulator [Candidatus Acetothermia bacterium]|nr:helix-turn-helix transcriptional regulator [Candidatus Acetothermia bacterium]MBI3659532.1 helix-turn-helix transcriptional regulator [Candidatus Acetothermia bacterium]
MHEETKLKIEDRRRGDRCCDTDLKLRLKPDETEQLSEDIKILAHPVRLQILDILSRNAGQVCVCDLEAALPVKQPTVSHHLKLLRDAGLIDCACQGLWAFYFVNRAALAKLRARVAETMKLLG